MRFWDSSGIVPLLVAETSSAEVRRLAENDPAMLVWWGSEIECVSALIRRQRDGTLDDLAFSQAWDRLQHLANSWHQIDPADTIKETAVRFLRVHPLRAADALQLAAAFVAAGRRPGNLELVTLDERLGAAARKEGFVLSFPNI